MVIAVASALSSMPVDLKVASVPTLVMFVCAAVCNVPVNVPPVIAPVVVIVDEPVSMLPNPLVIDPEFNAPVDTMLATVNVPKATISTSSPSELE